MLVSFYAYIGLLLVNVLRWLQGALDLLSFYAFGLEYE